MIEVTKSEEQRPPLIKAKSKVTPDIWVRRLIVYVAGLFILAMGVAFSIQSGLGVSPVSSFPYAISIVTAMNVGLMTTIVFAVYVLMQIALLRRKFPLKHLFQLVIAFLFGSFVDLSMIIVSALAPVSYLARLSYLGISLVLIAVGILFYLTANVIPMPAEGLVLTLQKVTKVPFSRVKVIFDVTSVSFAAILLFTFYGNIIGLREGTLLAALGVGKLIGVFSKWIKPPLLKFCKVEITEE